MNSNTMVREHLVNQLPKIREIVYQISKNEGVVDDIVQECCVRIIEKEQLWNGNKHSLSQWLNTIARNLARRKISNISREHEKQVFLEEMSILEDGPRFSEKHIEWVVQEFVTLPERQKRILRMRYYKGMKMIDIADELNISQPAVSEHVKRGLSKLQSKARKQGLFAVFCPWKWNFKVVWNLIIFNRVTEIISLVVALLFIAGVGKWMFESMYLLGGSVKNPQVEKKLVLDAQSENDIFVGDTGNKPKKNIESKKENYEKKTKAKKLTSKELKKALTMVEMMSGNMISQIDALKKFKGMTDEDLEILIEIKTHIDIKRLSNLVRYLKPFTSLTSAYINDIINYEDLKILSEMNNLKTIRVSVISEDVLKILSQQNTNLKIIHHDIKWSKGVLTSLNLEDTKVTDAGLQHLRDLKSLTDLNLEDTKVTDAGLQHLRDLKSLTSLNLNYTKVTDAGLQHLRDLKSLTDLNLEDTKVTDAGLQHLRDLKSLTDLNLEDTEVTDAGLQHLSDLKFLTSLNLKYTKVTEQGFKELGKALPNCEIDH